jgi:uncharacterized protein (TIGR02118 family)
MLHMGYHLSADALSSRSKSMWQLRAGILAASLIISSAATSEELKLTVLYKQPQNAEEFDKYYFGKHMPMVYALKEVKKTEVAKQQPAPNGSPPPYYIVTELWFDSPEVFKAMAATPEWKAIVDDVANFAPPGTSTAFASIVEPKK